MKMSVGAMTLVLSALLIGGVRAQEMDAEGFIKHWLMLAPIDISEGAASEEIDKQQVPDEAKLAPKEGEKALVKNKEMAWKKIQAKDYYFDVNEILGGESHQGVAGYFFCLVESAEEQKDIKLQMGSNDQGKVYLNEKPIITFSETRTIEKDQNAETVTLNKGVNKLVFKVINDSNNWQGCMRFTTKDGKPVAGLKIKLVP